jgi:hypothetical protein
MALIEPLTIELFGIFGQIMIGVSLYGSEIVNPFIVQVWLQPIISGQPVRPMAFNQVRFILVWWKVRQIRISIPIVSIVKSVKNKNTMVKTSGSGFRKTDFRTQFKFGISILHTRIGPDLPGTEITNRVPVISVRAHAFWKGVPVFR